MGRPCLGQMLGPCAVLDCRAIHRFTRNELNKAEWQSNPRKEGPLHILLSERQNGSEISIGRHSARLLDIAGNSHRAMEYVAMLFDVDGDKTDTLFKGQRVTVARADMAAHD